MFGASRRERGEFNERKVLAAFRETPPLPAWLKTVERASAKLDAKGVDFVAMTDVGKVYLQVKSSDFGAKKAHEKRPRAPIAVVVIRIDDTPETVRAKCVSALGALRNRFLNSRKALEYFNLPSLSEH